MTTAPAFPLIVIAIGLAGVCASPLIESLIARRMPRLGGMPSVRIKITTAAITGALTALLTMRFGLVPQLPAFLILAVIGVQLTRVDFSLHLLPNSLVLVLLGAGAILLTAAAVAGAGWQGMLRAALGALILFAIYLILGLISPGGIGMGDVKLAAPLGLYLGYLGWGQLFYGGALGFVVGGVLTVLMLRLRRANKPSEVAHGPSMLAAALGVILLMR